MNKKIIIILYVLMFYLSVSAQLLRPLGLGFNGGERQGNSSQPRMHVEGNRLYVCTNQGLYAKDLSADNGTWHLVGFRTMRGVAATFWPCAIMRAAVSCSCRTTAGRHTRM